MNQEIKKMFNKVIGMLLLLALWSHPTKAALDASSYQMNLKNGSSLVTGTKNYIISANTSNALSSRITLPFNFTLDGATYSHLIACSDGWVKLGNGTMTASANFNNSLNDVNDRPKIAPFWDEMNIPSGAGQGVSVFTSGISPFRMFVIEWTVAIVKNGTGRGTFQLVLHEGSNQIQFIYNNMQNNSSNQFYSSYSAGIAGTGTDFASLTMASNGNHTVSYNTVNNANNNTLPNGTSVMFTKTITSNSSAMLFSNLNTHGFKADWTKGNGQNRLVVCRPSNAAAVVPANFTNYTANAIYGDGSMIGSGFVVLNNNLNSVTVTNLNSNSNYCLDVYEYTGTISDGSAVFQTDEYSACQNTQPLLGSSNFVVNGIGYTSVTFSWDNGNGNERIVLVSKGDTASQLPTDYTRYNASLNYGSGSQIGNAYVVYASSNNALNTSITVNNLETGSTYYFTVIEYEYNGEVPVYANHLKLSDASPTLSNDIDEDGVADEEDAFPFDPNKAYKTNYPASGFGTLMYEDLWPGKGDYDFNDLVVDYQYEIVSNANDQVVEVNYNFVTRAIGGALHNGFGFQLDNILPGKITSVNGTRTNGVTWTSFNTNGTEAGNNTEANIIVFKDAYDLLPTTGGYWFVNVEENAPDVGNDTASISIKFINNGVVPQAGTVSTQQLAHTKFNPYIIVGQERGKEIHLADKRPSAKMNMSYFGTVDDNSIPAQNRYYKTDANLPWALNIGSSIPYTKEKNDFSSCFPNFSNWAQSGGLNNANWHTNANGNRVSNRLMNR
jgi:LruC domain-containing protein